MVAKPAGIRTVITGIPSHTGHDASTPRRYFRLGGFTLGNTDGFAPAYPFEYAQQLLYPIPAIWELLAYDIRDGASCLFQELVDVPDLSLKQPWDRTPLHVDRDAWVGSSASVGETTGWTYTVPTGRRLWLSSARIHLHHPVASTSSNFAYLYIEAASNRILDLQDYSNAAGLHSEDAIAGAQLVLAPGTVLAFKYAATFSGGTWYFGGRFSGFLFDA